MIVIGIAIAGKKLLYAPTNLNWWIDPNWSIDVSIEMVLRAALMHGGSFFSLDNVVWSLVHEMRISLVFPFIMLLIQRLTIRQNLLLAVGISVTAACLSSLYRSNYFDTLHYSAFFVIGALLARHQPRVPNKKVLVPLAMLLFIYPDVIYPSYEGLSTSAKSWFVAVGASVFILVAIEKNGFSRFLNWSPMQFLSKISYSLYLIHVVIILYLIHATSLSTPWVCVITVPLSLLVATLLYHTVEKRSIMIGSWLTKAKAPKGKVKAKELIAA
jgi:peptidoglycan/LPS O-acetylase OafA/YrhL